MHMNTMSVISKQERYQPEISIVIVNYFSWDLILNCLKKLKSSSNSSRQAISYEVIIVDNGSSEQIVELARLNQLEIKHIKSERNLGFSKATNIGIQSSNSSYILLLNPDTEISNHTLNLLHSFMEKNRNVAVVGPKLIKADGNIDMACHRNFPRFRDLWYVMFGFHLVFPKSKEFARFNMSYVDFQEPTLVDIVSGACMLVRRSATSQVGLLDEDFYLYGEDLDWCYRFGQQGWKVYYLPEAVAVHYKSAVVLKSGWRPPIEFYLAIYRLYKKYFFQQEPFYLNSAFLAAFIIRTTIGMIEWWIRKLKNKSHWAQKNRHECNSQNS
jgi:GT2 family glycosyltransferase